MSALKAAYPEPLGVKIVKMRTRLSYDYAYELLSRAAKAEAIEKVRHGFYRFKPEGPPETAQIEFRVENIVLVAKTRKPRPRGGGPSGQTTLDSLKRAEGPPGLEREKERVFYEAWAVAISEFRNGTIEVQVGTRGIPGMSFVNLLGFCGWLSGKFPDIPDDGPEGWFVRSWEWNRDIGGIRLEGATSITLRAARNAWLKLYQRSGGILRVELRQMLRDVSWGEAQTILREVVERFLKLGLVRAEDIEPP